MTHSYGLLVLLQTNSEMFALGTRPMGLSIYMRINYKMQQIISILLLTTRQRLRFIWEILVCIISETIMELIDLLLRF